MDVLLFWMLNLLLLPTNKPKLGDYQSWMLTIKRTGSLLIKNTLMINVKHYFILDVDRFLHHCKDFKA